MTIALLCPSRGRPEQLNRMVESAYNASENNIGIYIAVSPEEFEVYKNTITLPENNSVGVVLVTMPDNLPTAHKWNKLSELAVKSPPKTGVNFFMLAADDMIFLTPGWDKAIIDHYNSLENKIHVYALQDSRDENGTPHIIITREYIEAMGYFVPPIFLHWFIDTWTVEIAKANNCFTHLKDYILTHDKPSDRGGGDETHNRIRGWGWRERDAYVNGACQHFLAIEKDRLRTSINNTKLS